jgi:hypothetical protein
MSARTAAKAAALALLLLATSVRAQDPGWQVPGAPVTQPNQTTPTLHFTKLPNEAMPVPGSAQPNSAIGRSPWENRPTAPAAQPTVRRESPVQPSLQQVGFQPKYPTPALPPLNNDESAELIVPLEPPGPQRLYRLDSEADLMERMRQEGRERRSPERITFPEEPVISRMPHAPRTFPEMVTTAEPNYVLYGRLFFEEKNSERYGWDLGVVSPIVSAGAFYWDLALTPYQIASLPFRRFESNAGLCLPGDPVPYRLYPPSASMTGTVAEAAVIVALFAVFP